MSIQEALQNLAYECAKHYGRIVEITLDEQAYDALINEFSHLVKPTTQARQEYLSMATIGGIVRIHQAIKITDYNAKGITIQSSNKL